MLEIRHLKTLLALREHGSLVAAANDLCLTPSAISHQLKELDHWYGVGWLIGAVVQSPFQMLGSVC